MKVLIYGQRLNEDQDIFLDSLLSTLADIGSKVCFYSEYATIVRANGYELNGYEEIANTTELKKLNPDFVITMGGDGTILKVITLVQDSEIPIVGINLGRLGFLASIEKKKIRKVILELSRGEYVLENRSLLELSCNKEIFGKTKYALNDFTITKRDDSSMVKIKTFVNDRLLNVYWADGIIMATPTGSTGYSLSCGGPIIFPQSNNFVITPIAPHNLNVRPVVMSDTSIVRFEIEGRAENFLTTLDSRFEKITADHIISMKKCAFRAKLVQPNGVNFMSTINSKLMWGLDMRN